MTTRQDRSAAAADLVILLIAIGAGGYFVAWPFLLWLLEWIGG